MNRDMTARMQWYIQHRLEYLRKRKGSLQSQLDPDLNQNVDYEALREFMEIIGRIRELESVLRHADSW